MIARSFLKLCRYKHLIPQLFNIEKLSEFVEATLPPITQGEIDYYDNKKLNQEYNDDKNYQTTMVEPMINEKGEVMEPALHFHEFLFLLGLIAKNCMPGKEKDGKEIDNSIQTKLTEFYTQRLNFNPVKVADMPDPTYDQVLHYMSTDAEERFGGGKSLESLSGGEDEWESGSEQEEILELIERQNARESAIQIDWEQFYTAWNDLPKIPARPVVEQINPPPYAMPRIRFGKLMPKPEDEEGGGKKKKKAPKKAAKKDGPPPKPIKWEDGPPKYVKHTVHHMAEARNDIVENLFPLNIRGD